MAVLSAKSELDAPTDYPLIIETATPLGSWLT
jgi:hypothetical protein